MTGTKMNIIQMAFEAKKNVEQMTQEMKNDFFETMDRVQTGEQFVNVCYCYGV